MYDLENDLSCNRGCLHGCDPNTGACICSVGYQLRAGHKCVGKSRNAFQKGQVDVLCTYSCNYWLNKTYTASLWPNK